MNIWTFECILICWCTQKWHIGFWSHYFTASLACSREPILRSPGLSLTYRREKRTTTSQLYHPFVSNLDLYFDLEFIPSSIMLLTSVQPDSDLRPSPNEKRLFLKSCPCTWLPRNSSRFRSSFGFVISRSKDALDSITRVALLIRIVGFRLMISLSWFGLW